ncbi:hypothetical protein V491_08325 [Pseudogymnoascus sp. VKM F-3775]|nr:hypothetical protein V491_08325 [Pseudogymnoascus sp. VKM F-3775]
MSSFSSRESDTVECVQLDPTISDKLRTESFAASPGSLSDSSQADAMRSSHLGSSGPDTNSLLNAVEGSAAGAVTGRGSTPKRNTLSAVANAAENARKWGLNALQRSRDQTKLSIASELGSETPDLTQPMGRGKPLPPPGTPLPLPERRTKTAPIPVPKRRPLPPPHMESEQSGVKTRGSTSSSTSHQAPPQPKRHSRNDYAVSQEGVLVVAAPDSEPVSPTEDSANASIPHWESSGNDDKPDGDAGISAKKGPLFPANVLESPESLHKPPYSDRDTSSFES